MSRTFVRRRTYIINEKNSVQQICSDYPLLQKPNYVWFFCVQLILTIALGLQVALEYNLVMKDGRKEKFERKWEMWSPAVIEYALATTNKSAGLKHALRDL